MWRFIPLPDIYWNLLFQGSMLEATDAEMKNASRHTGNSQSSGKK